MGLGGEGIRIVLCCGPQAGAAGVYCGEHEQVPGKTGEVIHTVSGAKRVHVQQSADSLAGPGHIHEQVAAVEVSMHGYHRTRIRGSDHGVDVTGTAGNPLGFLRKRHGSSRRVVHHALGPRRFAGKSQSRCRQPGQEVEQQLRVNVSRCRLKLLMQVTARKGTQNEDSVSFRPVFGSGFGSAGGVQQFRYGKPGRCSSFQPVPKPGNQSGLQDFEVGGGPVESAADDRPAQRPVSGKGQRRAGLF